MHSSSQKGSEVGTPSPIADEGTHSGQEILNALMSLIEEAIAVHLQLQILTEQLHDHSELSRACRGILRDLYRLGPRTVPQLTRGRPVSRQNVLVLVNRLITDGLAESIRNPEHKRSYLVQLTPRGKALLGEMWTRETTLLNSLDLNLSVEELQAAANVLHRLRASLEKRRIDQAASSS